MLAQCRLNKFLLKQLNSKLKKENASEFMMNLIQKHGLSCCSIKPIKSIKTDLIKKEGKNFLHEYFAKSRSIDSFGLVISGILGAFLVKQFGVSIIWIAAGISFFVTFLLLGFAKEHFIKRKIKMKIIVCIISITNE